jgi:hypothetical protein
LNFGGLLVFFLGGWLLFLVLCGVRWGRDLEKVLGVVELCYHWLELVDETRSTFWVHLSRTAVLFLPRSICTVDWG